MFDEEIVAVDRATQIVIHTQSGFKTFEGCVEDVIDYGEQAVEAYKQSLIEGLDKAVEKWSKEGRTPEQIYGARNFITSGHFIQLIKESGE